MGSALIHGNEHGTRHSSPSAEGSSAVWRYLRPRSLRDALLLGGLFALTIATPGSAHESGTVKLSANQLPVGGALTVEGAKLGKGASYRLELRGALKTFSFGRVRADTAGRFVLQVTLPADAGAGAYTVAAVAADGDVSAQADLAIMATIAGSTAGMAAGHGMGGMPGMAGMMAGMPNATAEYMKVPRSTTTAGWVVIGLVIAISGVFGMLLFRRQEEPHVE